MSLRQVDGRIKRKVADRSAERKRRKAAEEACCDIALEFLQNLRPQGPWVLTAIIPDGRTSTMTANTEQEAEDFIRAYNGVRNLYYSVNPTRGALNTKAKKLDIAAIEYLFVDLDPKEGEPTGQAKARYLRGLDKLPEPTFIVESGNGIQALWELDQPIRLGKPIKGDYSEAEQATIADVEGRNKAMMERLGSKAGTQNIDRIGRLPGTINIPNKKKREQGRTECLSLRVHGDDGDLGPAHSLSAFPQLKAPTSAKSPAASDGSETTSEVEFVTPRRRPRRLRQPARIGVCLHDRRDTSEGC